MNIGVGARTVANDLILLALRAANLNSAGPRFESLCAHQCNQVFSARVTSPKIPYEPDGVTDRVTVHWTVTSTAKS
jgi:hypothetical protein